MFSLLSVRTLSAAAALMLVVCVHSLQAQSNDLHLTGSLQTDLQRLTFEANPDSGAGHSQPVIAQHKSVWLAGAMSVVVPGAGQIYAGAPWWRTALYGAIEALSFSAYFIYNNKGNRATSDFQQYADSHWDVVRYVHWIETNYQRWTDQQIDKAKAAEALAGIYRSQDPSLPPWERIDFTQLNKLEKTVKGGFSHTLPIHGDQQYYEEIGKYAQYRSGWDDHAFDADTTIYAPQFTTERNLDYVEQRNLANRYLGYATWGITAVIANHLASMIDAAFEARGYNLRLNARLEHEESPNGTLRPSGRLELRVGF
jgi:hypothetical protein